jgi:hypothetical protein
MEDDLVEIKLGQVRIEGELTALRLQQEANHRQNRDSIHTLHNGAQTILDRMSVCEGDVVNIKLFIARMGGYAAASGALVAVIFKLIDHLWK